VDDDVVIAHVYRVKLFEAGYTVDVAEDGLVALRMLNAHPPDLVVLDVMMPKFNGLEVLDYIRSRPNLSAIKVIVLSNFYFDGNDRRVVLTKADCGLVKSSCTPKKLIEAVAGLLAGGHGTEAMTPAPAVSPATAFITKAANPEPVAATDPAPPNAREDFLKNTAKTMASLCQLNEAFAGTEDRATQDTRLLEFYRKVHFVTALAGQAGCSRIALLLNALEALLLELHEKPEHINASSRQTIAITLDFLAGLLAQADKDTVASGFYARALVVDDEPISARAASSALHRAGFNVVTLHESVVALAKLRKENFDLILLDIVMPGLDGLEVCQRVRELPRYHQTPIIFVTGHADFLDRADTLRTGGNDVIAKPFLPIELALKAVTHWLRSKMPSGTAGTTSS
jgi:CheY-like chemotaxis protein